MTDPALRVGATAAFARIAKVAKATTAVRGIVAAYFARTIRRAARYRRRLPWTITARMTWTATKRSRGELAAVIPAEVSLIREAEERTIVASKHQTERTVSRRVRRLTAPARVRSQIADGTIAAQASGAREPSHPRQVHDAAITKTAVECAVIQIANGGGVAAAGGKRAADPGETG